MFSTKIFPIILLTYFFHIGAMAQTPTLLLDVNGNQPSPYLDHTGNHVLTPVAGMTSNADTLAFTTGNDYLQIDNFASFGLDSCWVLEVDLKVSNANDPIAILDWRSTSLTGHMQWAYDTVKGVYFSDRNINGLYGNLVADSMFLPNNQWVSLKMEKTIDSFFIYRNGIQTAGTAFSTPALSPVATTTIGYSLDFRYPHATFYMDNIKFYACSTPLSYTLISKEEAHLQAYPNPVLNHVTLAFEDIHEEMQVEILDLQGRVLQQKLAQQVQQMTLNIETLNPGIYIAKIIFDNNISTIKLIKE